MEPAKDRIDGESRNDEALDAPYADARGVERQSGSNQLACNGHARLLIPNSFTSRIKNLERVSFAKSAASIMFEC